MAQHDYVIANGTGAAVRSDLNNALAAIVSQNSGATAPATTYAYQWWPDTTTGLLKIRNAANNAWVTVGTLASTNLGLASLAGATFTGDVILGTTTALELPDGTTGERPGTPANGMIRYNTTLGTFEGYKAGAWGEIGGVRAGNTLQVVNATYSTGASTTSTSYVDTNLTASITPTSASSKILAVVFVSGVGKNGNGSALFQLVRGSTALIEFEKASGNDGGSGQNMIGAVGTSYLDSPNTTSSTTYKVQFKASGSFTIYAHNDSSVSTITLMEVAA